GVIQNSVGAVTVTKAGAAILTLGGANTYSGDTTIAAGTLALSATGSISNTPSITIASAATFDVSGAAPFVLSGATTLATAATADSSPILKGSGIIDLNSRPIVLAYDGTHPLFVSQGALLLNGNAFTVNGSPLPVGVYTVIAQASGTVSATG